MEPEVEAAQQFDEPLMHERFGHKDQRALHTSGEDEPVQDEAGLDCLSEPDFIRKKHSRYQPARHLGGNVDLMRKQINASSEEAAHPRLSPAMLMVQCGCPQLECFGGVEVAEKQAFFGLVEADGVTEVGLGKLLAAIAVIEDAA